MYLTKLELNPRHRDARRDLANPYEMHRTIRRAYGDTKDRILFRIETNERGENRTVLVQSMNQAPDWHFLEQDLRGYVYEMQSKTFDPKLVEGQYLRFSLIANPTRKERRLDEHGNPTNGRRVALITNASLPEYLDSKQGYYRALLIEWLQGQGARHGFQVLDADIITEWYGGTFKKLEEKQSAVKKQNIPLFAVRYDGLLKVADPIALKNALGMGIGSGKAFGFGLLTLSRV